MLFQILDDRRECFGIYSNGTFIYDRLPTGLTHTWSWNPALANESVEYANLYVAGKSLADCGPPNLTDRYALRSKKIKGFVNSVSNAKINFNDICLFDVVPSHHLKHYCEIKNDICEWIFENYEKPQNHAFLSDLYAFCHDISQNIVITDLQRLFRHSKNDKKAYYLFNQLKDENKPIMYDLWGSATGRLTTKEGSFPILNLKKEIADIVIPKNDILVQLDFNGAEIRTLLSLTGKTQPEEDIHEWNMTNVFNSVKDRSIAKQKFFAWFYNPTANDAELDKVYDRKGILKKYYNDGLITTPFGRKIEVDEFRSLNYLLQSSSSDNCLQSAIKVHKYLNDKSSFVHSVVHDSIVIDMKFEERQVLPTLLDIFSDTKLGRFRTSVHIGKNLKQLESVQW